MRFDYNIYKKRFPTFLSSYFALAGLIIISLIIVSFLYALFTKKNKINYSYLLSIFFYGFSLGFLIYALYTYITVNKNKKLNELKSIKSDEFINSMIDDFVTECKKSTLIVVTLILNAVSIIINIMAMIFYYKSP